MSDSRNMVSLSTMVIVSGRSCRCVNAMTFMPIAVAMRDTAVPMYPMPTMPIVLPASSMSGVSAYEKSAERLHAPLVFWWA